MNVGDRVRIERDETRYPCRGTWPRYRGRIGTVVEVNRDSKRPHLTEFGVVFGKVRSPRSNGSLAMAGAAWFRAHELVALAAERHAETFTAPAGVDSTGEDVRASFADDLISL